MNIITFGKYKGMPVTRVLRIDPSYFGWCKNNVRWFKFSKRDYEIYLEWLSLQQNHLQFTGYSDDMGNIRFLFRKVEEGKFNAYSPVLPFPTNEMAFNNFIYNVKYFTGNKYLVTGDLLDETGTDGEPLIKNVKILKKL